MSIATKAWKWVTSTREAERVVEAARKEALKKLQDTSEHVIREARTPLDDVARKINGKSHDMGSD